jgi:hypothetical protein
MNGTTEVRILATAKPLLHRFQTGTAILSAKNPIATGYILLAESSS